MTANSAAPWSDTALSFAAVVGQARMKLALLLAAIDPTIGGVLIRGERGTAKSTLVRALARILPPRQVVADCLYGCSLNEPYLCADCHRRRAEGEGLRTHEVPARVVELPLGASEDRLVGSLDMEAALQSGKRVFQPGVLADANGQILYVDEVNLLDHHLVDVLLDAAAMGVNVVEREGISASHPARFVLVGTMNPEEGELRPQLLDRFGLCVDVTGLRDPASRIAVMERNHEPDENDDAQDAATARQLGLARALLPRVEVPKAVVQTAAAIAIDQQVVGHRADLTLYRAARARRALRAAADGAPDQLEVSLEDLVDITELVLVHRRRSAGGGRIAAAAGDQTDPASDFQQRAPDGAEPDPTPDPSGSGGGQDKEGAASEQTGESGAGAEQTGAAIPGSPGPCGGDDVEIADATAAGSIQLPRERLRRHGSGRRSQTVSRDRRGRYVGATVVERTTDLALDATLRAAAPHQRGRRVESGASLRLAVQLEKRDLRQKVRQRRIGNLIVFLVDASASMDAEQRMDATRSAILALLRDAYVRRDRVAMISFSGRTARTVLRPTASVDLAERQLARLAVGGTTPLTHGLMAGLDLIRSERLRDPEVLPLLVLISDGRGNISLRGEEPLVEAQQAAASIRREQIRALVIDSSRDHLQPAGRAMSALTPGPRFAGYAFNACIDLADRMGARYFGLFDVSEQGILQPVAEALRRLG